MKTAVPTEILDKDGNLLRIEFHEQDGTHIIDAQWDMRDSQTNDNRAKFRQWCYDHVEHNLKYEVVK